MSRNERILVYGLLILLMVGMGTGLYLMATPKAPVVVRIPAAAPVVAEPAVIKLAAVTFDELESMANSVVLDDLLAIDDVSATTTKGITVGQLLSTTVEAIFGKVSATIDGTTPSWDHTPTSLGVGGTGEFDGITYHDADVYMADDKFVGYGASTDAKALYETADDNALGMLFALPHVTENANNVPVAVFADNDALNVDLGLFDGMTQPTIALVDADRDSFLALSFRDDDSPAIDVGGSATTVFFSDTVSVAGAVTFTTGISVTAAEGLKITASTPATSTATCTHGMITADASYIYFCTATDTWERATLATW